MLRPTLFILLAFIPLVSAVIPSLPTGWSHMGCMNEGEDPDVHLLQTPYLIRNDMTIRVCVDNCIRQGYTYAGLQNSNQCVCGNSLLFTQQVDDSECNSPCTAASDQPCGGHVTYMTVLRYTASAPAPPPPAPTTAPTTTKAPVVVAPPPSSSTQPTAAPTTSSPLAVQRPSTPDAGQSQAPAASSSTTQGTAAGPGTVSPPLAPIPASSSRSTNPDSPQPNIASSLSSLSSGAIASSSTSVSAPPIEITQYLKPASPSASVAPNQFSGTGLQIGANSGSVPAPTSDRFANRTIVLPGPSDAAPPRLRDESQMIVFGTYINSGRGRADDVFGFAAAAIPLAISFVLAVF